MRGGLVSTARPDFLGLYHLCRGYFHEDYGGDIDKAVDSYASVERPYLAAAVADIREVQRSASTTSQVQDLLQSYGFALAPLESESWVDLLNQMETSLLRYDPVLDETSIAQSRRQIHEFYLAIRTFDGDSA